MSPEMQTAAAIGIVVVILGLFLHDIIKRRRNSGGPKGSCGGGCNCGKS